LVGSLVAKAGKVSSREFIQTVKDTTNLLVRQAKDGLVVDCSLVRFMPYGECLVIGDLHGDLKSLSTILTKSNFIQKLQTNQDAKMVFLGD
jgi:hypothetical protein